MMRRILKPIATTAIAAIVLVGCKSTKTTTQQTSTKTPEGQSIINETPVEATPKMVAKKGIMTKEEIQKWPHMDIYKDSVPGMSLDKAYAFLKGKSGKTVIVGVIDSGTDIEHEDLKDIVWTNKDEIANNGKDDDNNGYVDDIHGWNFLGGAKGASNPEQLEMTRILKKLKPKFEGKTAENIDAKDAEDFKLYEKLTKKVKEKIASAQTQFMQYQMIYGFIEKTHDTIKKVTGKSDYNLNDINLVTLAKPELLQGKRIIMEIVQSGESVDNALEDIKGGVDYFGNQSKYNYNVDFNGRVAGDNPYDITDKNYGNNDVIGSKDDESHGTHVSGIIAAKRNNSIGVNGVAHNVALMAVRAVPDGDEYDKDVALAIRYAVDNGAKVINMSFGKSYSTNPEWVYNAIKYAAEKDVLLVHAAGNDTADIDTVNNFPRDAKDKINEIASNLISVGSMTRNYNENLVSSFSNYGKNNVDIFAPGSEIYSTYPKNTYKISQGTSMAAPQVAGVAALIRSYYPTLTAPQVKKIIMDSGIIYEGKVTERNVDFKDLSVSGKILNAYNALRLAEKMAKK